MRKLVLSLAAFVSPYVCGQQIYFGAIGGTALTRDFPVFESVYGGDSYNPPSEFIHASGPRSFIFGGLFGVRLYGPLFLEANVLHRPMRADLFYTELPPGGSSVTQRSSYVAANAWEFPLMLKWEVPLFSEQRIRPFVEGGLAFRTEQNVSAVLLSPLGATVGAGVSLHLGSIAIAPTLRYTRWEKETHFPPYPSRADQIEFLTSVSWGTENTSWHVGGSPMHFGLLGGAGAPPTFAAPYGGAHSKIPFLAGVSAEVELHHNLSVEADGIYKPLRAGHTQGDKFSVLTWQFPVLMKYRWSATKHNPFVEAGPSLRAAGNLNGYNPSHFGVTAGGGVELGAGPVRITPTLRYTRWALDSHSSYTSSRPYSGTSPNALEMLFGVRF